MKIKQITQDIYQYQDFSKESSDILESISSKEWSPYTNTGGGETIIGRHINLWPSHTETGSHYRLVLDIFSKCVNSYALANNLKFNSDHIDSQFFIVREYQPPSEMHAHSDAYGYITHSGKPVVPKITALFYLNSDYQGGEINFIKDKICIKPETGSVIIFPSTIQHEVKILESGNRYMTQTYVYENPLDSYNGL